MRAQERQTTFWTTHTGRILWWLFQEDWRSNVSKKIDDRMCQINSKIKDDFQIDLVLSCFVGHPVFDLNLLVRIWKTSRPKKMLKNLERKLSRRELTRYFIQTEILSSDLKNWIFAINSSFRIPFSLQPEGANLWYYKLRLFYLTHIIVWII